MNVVPVLVYVAGKMSSENPLQFLRNLNSLQIWTARIRDLGFAPFPVADDYADIMRTTNVTIPQIKAASIAWLKRSDCMFVTPDWEGSPGVAAEIAVADASQIPVFYELDEMAAWGCGFRRTA